jgi:phosphate transport system substrate-binding protein
LRLQRLIWAICCALAACAITAPGAASAASSTLTGSGSTLIAPLEAEWAAAFGVFQSASITYSPIGSSAGITAVSSGQVDFGASEAPLTPAQTTACHGCYQIPWALTGVGISYHINSIGSALRLTGAVLAEIYQGQIKRWNDARIQSLNPRVTLPALSITPIYRAPGSGDTYVFTSYLASASSAWRSSVGSGATVTFPTGRAGGDNAGVIALLQSINGSIAYAAASYLIANKLPAAAIKNSAGNFEAPNLTNIEAAAASVKHVPSNDVVGIVNPPRTYRTAYPISTFSYVVVPPRGPHATLLKSWIDYALGAGQAFGPSLDFATIPSVVLSASRATAAKL